MNSLGHVLFAFKPDYMPVGKWFYVSLVDPKIMDVFMVGYFKKLSYS